jgi:hypothetical protein
MSEEKFDIIAEDENKRLIRLKKDDIGANEPYSYTTFGGITVHYVKSARKDNPVAKKGESYYWFKKNKYGDKFYYKEYNNLPDEYKVNMLTQFIYKNDFCKQHIKEAIKVLLNKL